MEPILRTKNLTKVYKVDQVETPALENAAFVLELQGVGRKERERRAMAALGELGIAEFAKRFPNQLSGGQQQRVAVARAIAGEPKLVLADEPTANLDSKTGLTLIELMKHLNTQHGVTFVFSTHDPRLLEHVQRIVRLEDGHIVGEETGVTHEAGAPQKPQPTP